MTIFSRVLLIYNIIMNNRKVSQQIFFIQKDKAALLSEKTYHEMMPESYSGIYIMQNSKGNGQPGGKNQNLELG